MVNRISTSGRYSQLVADMQKQLSNYNRLTQQLASGSKINAITDDPIGAVNILNTNRQLGQIDIFTQNVEMSMKELSTLDDLMDLATGYLSTAWDKAVQANNQTYGKSSLEALKVEIDEITKTMVDLAMIIIFLEEPIPRYCHMSRLKMAILFRMERLMITKII